METPERVLSGSSTNACLALRRLGDRATLVGCIGDDFRERLIAYLTDCDVAFRLLPSCETGGFLLKYDERGNRTLKVLRVADVIPPVAADGWKDVDFVLLGPLLGETGAELVQSIYNCIDALILLDPQGLLREAEGDRIVYKRTALFDEIVSLCTIIKANEVEAEIVTGINARRDPAGAVRELHKVGTKITIVTLAELGSIIYDGAKVYKIPAYRVAEVDPTGAGDVYSAGFVYCYENISQDMRAIGCFASAAASMKVEHSGPDFAVNLAEVKRRWKFLLDEASAF